MDDTKRWLWHPVNSVLVLVLAPCSLIQTNMFSILILFPNVSLSILYILYNIYHQSTVDVFPFLWSIPNPVLTRHSRMNKTLFDMKI